MTLTVATSVACGRFLHNEVESTLFVKVQGTAVDVHRMYGVHRIYALGSMGGRVGEADYSVLLGGINGRAILV